MAESPFTVQNSRVYFQNLSKALENSKLALLEARKPAKRVQMTTLAYAASSCFLKYKTLQIT